MYINDLNRWPKYLRLLDALKHAEAKARDYSSVSDAMWQAAGDWPGFRTREKLDMYSIDHDRAMMEIAFDWLDWDRKVRRIQRTITNLKAGLTVFGSRR